MLSDSRQTNLILPSHSGLRTGALRVQSNTEIHELWRRECTGLILEDSRATSRHWSAAGLPVTIEQHTKTYETAPPDSTRASACPESSIVAVLGTFLDVPPNGKQRGKEGTSAALLPLHGQVGTVRYGAIPTCSTRCSGNQLPRSRSNSRPGPRGGRGHSGRRRWRLFPLYSHSRCGAVAMPAAERGPSIKPAHGPGQVVVLQYRQYRRRSISSTVVSVRRG